MLQRLGLADVLVKDPEIIILDEPTLGIDPKGILEFLELIVELSREEGLTVLFSSHDLHQVQKVCHRVGLFVKGKLLAEGDVQTLSEKLFAKNSFTIEAIVSKNPFNSVNNNYSAGQLIEKLKNIDGIIGVTVKDNVFQIESAYDTTPEIAKVIVESGAGLNYLNKKEFGLDDIYYRYFEEVTDHE